VLRNARPDDTPALAAIEAAVFSDPWPEAAFARMLGEAHVRIGVAVDVRDRPIGYCVLLRAADEGEIGNIAVASAHRGMGIGALLLDDALAAADAGGTDRLFLEVRVSNVVARALYGSRGFEVVGHRRGYYGAPVEDALVMRRIRPA
jgi:ribosomal-protein-alanine N-acetyltransferase